MLWHRPSHSPSVSLSGGPRYLVLTGVLAKPPSKVWISYSTAEFAGARVMLALELVIFLDWSGVDLSLNPLHLASKLFDSRSSIEL